MPIHLKSGSFYLRLFSLHCFPCTFSIETHIYMTFANCCHCFHNIRHDSISSIHYCPFLVLFYHSLCCLCTSLFLFCFVCAGVDSWTCIHTDTNACTLYIRMYSIRTTKIDQCIKNALQVQNCTLVIG